MRRLFFAALMLLLLVLVTSGYAQDGGKPLVVFVLERDLQTSSVADPGPDGVSTVAEIFRSLGAQTQFVRLSEPLPQEAKVVVVPRPLRAISTESLARLWRHIENGNNLLYIIDPVGYPGTRAERAGSGLDTLLTVDYGVSFLDTFLAEPWFTNQTIANLEGSVTRTYADLLPHPVIAPLVQYGLPVHIWGARTVQTEPFGIESFAYPMLDTMTAFGETNRNVLMPRDEPGRLELNLGEDELGLIHVAGIGENVKTGTRIAVIGDGEMLQNGYGLAKIVDGEGGESPRFPGNWIFTQRVAAWLLDLPVEEWQSLPEGFTWLTLDGDDSDWDPALVATVDEDETAPAMAQYDIQQVRIFRNTDYAYVLVETAQSPDENVQVQITFHASNIAETVTLSAGLAGAFIEGETPIPVPDVQMVVGQVIEIRIPLRVTRIDAQLNMDTLCLVNPDDTENPEALDCLDQTIFVLSTPERDPVNLRFPEGPLVTIRSPNSRTVNLRRGPGIDFPTVTVLNNGLIMAVTGRNEAGDWIQIENARYTGWLLASLAISNADISTLPVVTVSP